MVAPRLADALRAHKAELRLRLCEWEHAGSDPEEGSDADLFLEALCSSTLEEYLPRFAASGERLAEQDGHLAVRLRSIQGWQEALSTAISDILADRPRLRDQAHMILGERTAQILVTLTLGYQGAQAQRITRATDQARRAAARMRALQRINSAANSTLDLDQTLTTAAEAVAEEMNADLCAIFLFDDISRELRLHATNGPLPRGGLHYTLALGEGYSGWVAQDGHPLVLADAVADVRSSAEALAYPDGFRGLLAVPIIFFNGVKLQGVIAAQTREPRTFSAEEIDFLEIIAGQLAMNIENGRLYEQTDEELRRKVHELSTLHRVSALVTSTLVLDTVLRSIVAQAVLLSGADRSVLFEADGVDGATRQLRAVASHGFERLEIAHAAVPVGECCVGRVARSGEPSMLIDCMRTDAGCFLRHAPEAIDDQHAVLCAPLNTVHGTLGALCVFSSQRHTLDAHQLQLVVTFANVAAIAIENARLFTETQQGLQAKEALVNEMHHRVKNNLQQVASILNMHLRRTRNPEVEQVLGEIVGRIHGIAAVHDLLSRAKLGMAPVDEIARKIVGIVSGHFVPPSLRIRFVIGSAPFHLPTEQATTLAIILNELIANAIEHGFEGREQGEIRISGVERDGRLILRVADDGQGLPANFSLATSDGLGLYLVRNLVSGDLHGSLRLYMTHGDPDIRLDARTDVTPSAAGDAEQNDDQSARTWTVSEIECPALFDVADATERAAFGDVG
ncbi:MAG: Two-component system sensor histidine kinase [Ktedonobacterales bacterium]|jgi:two-component sensor histidine kinase|nr:MAG: Two-component system sensor histidine kinase [Ktedonobacterales bacterium]